MQIHEVLKKTREALGKTQEEIAAAGKYEKTRIAKIRTRWGITTN